MPAKTRRKKVNANMYLDDAVDLAASLHLSGKLCIGTLQANGVPIGLIPAAMRLAIDRFVRPIHTIKPTFCSKSMDWR